MDGGDSLHTQPACSPESGSRFDQPAEDDAGTLLKHSLQRLQAIIEHHMSSAYIPSKIPGLEKQLGDLQNVIRGSISRKQSSSVILLGMKGTGKSLVLRTAIRDLRAESETKSDLRFIYVHLDLRLHPNEPSASNALVRLIERELKAKFNKLTSLDGMVAAIKAAYKAVKGPIIISLDEIDLFTHRERQAFLYTLGDLRHSPDVVCCLICLTPRFDIFGSLTSRVRSRFVGNEIVFSFLPNSEMLSRVLTQICTVGPEDDPDFPMHAEFYGQFNASVSSLFDYNPENPVLKWLESVFNVTRDLRLYHNILRVAISQLKPESPFLKQHMLMAGAAEVQKDPDMEMLKGVSSYVELGLLVAMMHLENDQKPYNFDKVWRLYLTFAAVDGHSTQDTILGAKAFESLLRKGFAKLVGHESHVADRYRELRLTRTADQVMAAVIENAKCTEKLHAWVKHRLG